MRIKYIEGSFLLLYFGLLRYLYLNRKFKLYKCLAKYIKNHYLLFVGKFSTIKSSFFFFFLQYLKTWSFTTLPGTTQPYSKVINSWDWWLTGWIKQTSWIASKAINKIMNQSVNQSYQWWAYCQLLSPLYKTFYL